MPIFTMVDGVWRECLAGQASKVKVGGNWRSITQAYTKINGVWTSTWASSYPGTWQSDVPGTYVVGPITSTSITATIIGGGGSGSAARKNNGSAIGGNGGLGGAYQYNITRTVPIGASVIVTVGAAGAAATVGAGASGTSTTITVNGVVWITAAGGSGGGAWSDIGQGISGFGGHPSSCPVYGGLGGETAAPSADYINMSQNQGQNRTVIVSANGIAGHAYGGGGGGAPAIYSVIYDELGNPTYTFANNSSGAGGKGFAKLQW